VKRHLLLLFLFACGDASFHVQMPPNFHEAKRTISVVSVYREGRFSPDSFEQIEPQIAAALGKGCEQGYTERLRESDPNLYDDIDQRARQDGISDEVIAQMAPAALGDTLMVVQFYGPLPQPKGKHTTGAAPMPQGRAPYSRGAAGMTGRTPTMGNEDPRYTARRADVQIAATLYSRVDHAFVGEVALTYAGKDVDEALRRFGARLAEELRGATCAGWKWPEPEAAQQQPKPDSAPQQPTP
jgi:hypothetical protein